MPPTKFQRTLGGLLGLHAGDTLGAALEFSPWEAIRAAHPTGLRTITGGGPFAWPAGHATDDTDLTRAVLLAYRDCALLPSPPTADPSAAADVATVAGNHMLQWLDGVWPGRTPGYPPVDIGAATLRGLQGFRASRDPGRAGAGPGRAGNGSLMRCIATGLFQPDRARMVAESVRISAITHDDARCIVACAAYNAVVAGMLAGRSPREAVEEGLGVAGELEGEATAVVQEAIRAGVEIRLRDLAETGPGPLKGKASGYVLESLTLAVSAVLDERSFEDVLVDVVRVGKDTDTNGAIAGGLLGVRDGVDAIPKDWVRVLQFAAEFEAITRTLLPEESIPSTSS